MKKNILFLSLCALIAFPSASMAQKLTSKQKKARQIFTEARLIPDEKEKIKKLKESIELDNELVESYWLISATYKELGDEVNTIIWLEKVCKPKFKNFDRTCFRLGKEYYGTGQYEKARETFGKAGNKYTQWQEKCNVAIDIKKRPVPFTPVNLTRVNTDYDDYWPSITADGKQISTTVLVGQREGARSLTAQEDIYHSALLANGEWSKGEPIGAPTNTPQNEGAQSFSVDGRYMFFIACDRASSVGGCDIYYSIRRGNMWSPAINPGKPLNSQYWETNPSFSPAGDELFFSSNRPGAVGGSGKDIWRSKVFIADNGQLAFSEPKNIGAPVNTSEEEFSPFIHADNKTLYFSSTGHDGLGGYDIFYSRRDDSGVWSTPRNIGYPINTHREEIGFCVNAQGNKAYLSSNGILKNGRGKDIYEIDLPEELRPEPMDFFEGKVWDSKTQKPIQAKIEVYKLDNDKTVFQSVSDEVTGEFQAFLPTADEYGYTVEKKGYLFVSGNLQQRDSLHTSKKVVDLRAIAVGEKVTLNNIFFDFDKSNLQSVSYSELKRVARFLRINSKVSVELAGHTDNVGSRDYNMRLSQARAKEVADYLLKQGVPPERVSYKGYGPDQPIADNATDEGRAKNRRTEIVITKIR
ncbi:MAG: OmpA family protein [Prevotellaceae bacterium]|jgi:outer membrane protein OmpA-like peptidoglycan-associated protein|nr:OmpA family protein [Prevotellaceae bacterium]